MSVLLTNLGYEVARLGSGVYKLSVPSSDGAGLTLVGMLLTSYPPQHPRLPVRLVVQEVETEEQVHEVALHWAQLDARALSGSGLVEIDLEVEVGESVSLEPQVFQKPHDAGLRFAIDVAPGGLICFN